MLVRKSATSDPPRTRLMIRRRGNRGCFERCCHRTKATSKHGADDEAPPGDVVAPAGIDRVREAVDDEEESRATEQRAEDVETRVVLAFSPGDEQRDADDSDRREDEIDEETPPPRRPLGQARRPRGARWPRPRHRWRRRSRRPSPVPSDCRTSWRAPPVRPGRERHRRPPAPRAPSRAWRSCAPSHRAPTPARSR